MPDAEVLRPFRHTAGQDNVRSRVVALLVPGHGRSIAGSSCSTSSSSVARRQVHGVTDCSQQFLGHVCHEVGDIGEHVARRHVDGDTDRS